MSHNFRNYNSNASDSNVKRRKIVLAPPGSNALRNDGCGRGPNMPSQKREVDLPKWKNQNRRRPYSRRPRRNIQNLQQIIAKDPNHDTNCLVCGDEGNGEFIGCASCPSTDHIIMISGGTVRIVDQFSPSPQTTQLVS
ncbi:hypothetical protein QL285_028562 [Trifolium repens]|nr:hypothetical protein QL285_028562 [Trifolium repens]